MPGPLDLKKKWDDFSDTLAKATEHQTGLPSFNLDKEKYPDVEETPYGFIYNVNGNSITDRTKERMTWGEKHYPKQNLGFGVFDAAKGEEFEFPTWEDAYKYAKGIK